MKTPSKKPKSRKFVKRERRDPYAEVTNRLIAHLESGKTIHDLGWDFRLGPVQNPLSGTRYRGANALLLSLSGFPDNRFCTFQQAKKKGWHVRKGEKALPVVFATRRQRKQESEDGDDAAAEVKTYWVTDLFNVFNFSQIEGAPELEKPDHSKGADWSIDPVIAHRIEAFVEATGAKFVDGGDRAAYSPSNDVVRMPPREVFVTEAEYYATKLHELGHWTGHASRLNRQFGNRAQTDLYAREELRAEIASAFLCAHFGIPARMEAHAGYVDNYLTILRGDQKEIFRAARDAEQICKFLLDLSDVETQIDSIRRDELAGNELRIPQSDPNGDNSEAEPIEDVFYVDELIGEDLASWVSGSEEEIAQAREKVRA